MTQLPDKKTALPLQGKWASVRSIHDTQRLYIRNEISQMHGLTAILMKHRNGGQWTEEDRAKLQRNLRVLSNLSPYLVPLLAWWLGLPPQGKARQGKTKPNQYG